MLDQDDYKDMRMARPVAVTDLWDIDERIERIKNASDRLEKIISSLYELYQKERVKNWEMILDRMIEQRKKGNKDVNRIR